MTDISSTQATRISLRFGGVSKLVQAMALAADLDPRLRSRTRWSVYRWSLPRTKGGGLDGYVPAAAMPCILAAAKVAGVKLRDKDLRP